MINGKHNAFNQDLFPEIYPMSEIIFCHLYSLRNRLSKMFLPIIKKEKEKKILYTLEFTLIK